MKAYILNEFISECKKRKEEVECMHHNAAVAMLL